MILFVYLADNTVSQDPAARITSVKAAQKFFSEDKDKSFEAKVMYLLLVLRSMKLTGLADDG
jgi:hypothetical protein